MHAPKSAKPGLATTQEFQFQQQQAQCHRRRRHHQFGESCSYCSVDDGTVFDFIYTLINTGWVVLLAPCTPHRLLTKRPSRTKFRQESGQELSASAVLE